MIPKPFGESNDPKNPLREKTLATAATATLCWPMATKPVLGALLARTVSETRNMHLVFPDFGTPCTNRRLPQQPQLHYAAQVAAAAPASVF